MYYVKLLAIELLPIQGEEKSVHFFVIFPPSLPMLHQNTQIVTISTGEKQHFADHSPFFFARKHVATFNFFKKSDSVEYTN